MLNERIAGQLNGQIGMEFYSAYLYLEMNNYFLERGLNGFAHWYEVQAKEELDHAMRIYRYLHDEGNAVELRSIDCPKRNFSSDREVLCQALQHEEKVTESINSIIATAYEIQDYRTLQFLDWFVAEQAEEETNARDMMTRLVLYGETTKGLYLLDHELGKRKSE